MYRGQGVQDLWVAVQLGRNAVEAKSNNRSGVQQEPAEKYPSVPSWIASSGIALAIWAIPRRKSHTHRSPHGGVGLRFGDRQHFPRMLAARALREIAAGDFMTMHVVGVLLVEVRE